MTHIAVQIPDQAVDALRLPPGHIQEQLQQEFAVFLVKEGLLDPASARLIADLDRLSFRQLLAKRQVEWGGSPEDAMQDFAAAGRAARDEPK